MIIITAVRIMCMKCDHVGLCMFVCVPGVKWDLLHCWSLWNSCVLVYLNVMYFHNNEGIVPIFITFDEQHLNWTQKNSWASVKDYDFFKIYILNSWLPGISFCVRSECFGTWVVEIFFLLLLASISCHCELYFMTDIEICYKL